MKQLAISGAYGGSRSVKVKVKIFGEWTPGIQSALDKLISDQRSYAGPPDDKLIAQLLRETADRLDPPTHHRRCARA